MAPQACQRQRYFVCAIAGGSTRASVGQGAPLSVAARKNLNPGGVLPGAIGVPVVAGAVLLGPVAFRQRRLDAA